MGWTAESRAKAQETRAKKRRQASPSNPFRAQTEAAGEETNPAAETVLPVTVSLSEYQADVEKGDGFYLYQGQRYTGCRGEQTHYGTFYTLIP